MRLLDHLIVVVGPKIALYVYAQALGQFGHGLAFDEASFGRVFAVLVALFAFHVAEQFELEKTTQAVVEGELIELAAESGEQLARVEARRRERQAVEGLEFEWTLLKKKQFKEAIISRSLLQVERIVSAYFVAAVETL